MCISLNNLIKTHLSKNEPNTNMVPVSMGCCHLFHDLLETDTDVCFFMIVHITVVILLSWLFGISVSLPIGMLL